MAWPSAQTVLIQAALELGLIQSSSDWGDDAYASTDGTVAQFRALLKKAGRDLVNEFSWSHLRQEFALLTGALDGVSGSTGVYSLPPDWSSMVDQTGWNRTNRLPLGGPLSEQEWQFLSSRQTGVVFNVLFQPKRGLLFLYPATQTPSGQEISMSYKSAWWVQNEQAINLNALTWATGYAFKAGTFVRSPAPLYGAFTPYYRCAIGGTPGTVGPDPTAATLPWSPKTSGALVDGTCVWNFVGMQMKEANRGGIGIDPSGYNSFYTFGTGDIPSTGTDLLMFDEELIVSKIKLLWLKAKGFDSSDTEREYANNFMQATSNDVAAPILGLGNQGMVRDRLLGGLNFPITGFGS